MTPATVDWRELERRRVERAQLNGTPIRPVSWVCDHLAHVYEFRVFRPRPQAHQRFRLRGRGEVA